MAKRRKQQTKNVPPDTKSPDRAKARTRRWRRWHVAAGVIFLLGCVVILAPTIIGRTFCLNRLIAYTTADFDGQIHVGPAWLTWWSPIRLHDVRFFDRDGTPLGTIASMRNSRSLAGLLMSWVVGGKLEVYPTLGKFMIEHPELTVTLTKSGSNWESALARWLAPSDASKRISAEFEITDGRISLHDLTEQHRAEITNFDLRGSLPARLAEPISIEWTADIPSRRQPGTINAKIVLTLPDASRPGYAGDVRVSSRSMPLAALMPLLPRWLPAVTAVDGDLTSDVTLLWNSPDGPSLSTDSKVAVQGLLVRTSQFMGQDELKLDTATMSVQLANRGGRCDIHHIRFDSPIGSMEGRGAVPSAMGTSRLPMDLLWESVEQGGLSASGTLNIAALAQALPQTLRLRDDTHIESGEVTWELSTKAGDGMRTLLGSVRATDLVATRDGQKLRFPQPLQLGLTVIEQSGDIRIEKCVGQSTWFSFSLRGNAEAGQLAAQADLKRFQSELRQIIDLTDVALDGRASARLRWRNDEQGLVTTNGSAEVEQLRVRMNGRDLVAESHLQVQVQTSARLDGTRVAEVRDAIVDVRSGPEHVVVHLSEPIALAAAGEPWSGEIDLEGNLAAWQSRAAAFVSWPDVRLSGSIRLHSDVRITNSEIGLSRATMDLADLRVKTSTNELAEKVVRLQGDLQLARSLAELTSPSTTLTSSSVAIRAQGLQARWDGKTPEVRGTFYCRGDLGRISRLLNLDASRSQVAGEFTGQFDLKQAGSTLAFEATADARQVRYSTLGDVPSAARDGVPRSVRHGVPGTDDAWRPLWYEPRIGLRAKGDADLSAWLFRFDHVQMDAESARVDAQGILSRAGSVTVTDIHGTAEWDLDVLTQRWRAYLGNHVQLSGRVGRPFLIQGPLAAASSGTMRAASTLARTAEPSSALVSPDLVAEAGIGWTRGSIFGIDLGENSIQARLKRREVLIDPMRFAVEDGHLTISPSIHLSGQTPMLELEHGRIAENVRLTPKVCQTWMKYIAPLLADATEADGQFSLELGAVSVPLADAAAANILGQLEIHAAQLRPGPLAREFLGIAQQIKSVAQGRQASRILDPDQALISLPAQEVTFRMQDRQIGHQGLTMEIGDVSVKTEGWVGLDERLALVAYVPIQDSWIGDGRLLSGLRGQSLEIPVTGTLQRPRLDTRSLGKLTEKAVVGATEKLLRDELGKQLDRLFRAK